jgi:hypothetical protein
MTGDGEVRRPWRHVAIPGEGPANRGIERAHEHQGKLGMRFPYLPRRGGGMPSTVRWSPGGSNGRRLGVEAIPAMEGRGLDRIRSGG